MCVASAPVARAAGLHLGTDLNKSQEKLNVTEGVAAKFNGTRDVGHTHDRASEVTSPARDPLSRTKKNKNGRV